MIVNRRLLHAVLLVAVLSTACPAPPPGAWGATAAKAANQKVSSPILASPKIFTSGTSTDATPCDAAMNQIGWCDTIRKVIFCDTGEWRTISCESVLQDSVCSVDVNNVVDCVK